MEHQSMRLGGRGATLPVLPKMAVPPSSSPRTYSRRPSRPRRSCAALSSRADQRHLHQAGPRRVPIKTHAKPKGAVALKLRELVIDAITVLMATGSRRSELLALRRKDFDTDAGTLAVTSKVVRVSGEGLVRLDETKSGGGQRTIPLPK